MGEKERERERERANQPTAPRATTHLTREKPGLNSIGVLLMVSDD